MNNLEKFIINPTNEFHILRHFKYVDDLYKETLIGQLYWYYDYSQKKFVYSKISQIDIENALKTIDAGFEKNISGIESPKKLLEIIKNRFQELLSDNKIYWIDNIEYKTATFTFDYQFSVGKMNCLNGDNILERDKARIKSVLRSTPSREQFSGNYMNRQKTDFNEILTKLLNMVYYKYLAKPYYEIAWKPRFQVLLPSQKQFPERLYLNSPCLLCYI